MDKLYIDGKDFTNDALSLEFDFEYGVSDDNIIEYQISDDLTMKGDAYRYIFDKHFSPVDLKTETQVVFYDSCCDKEYFFIIDNPTLSPCPSDCTIEFRLIKNSDDNKCHKYLNETIYWKGGPDEGFIAHAESIGRMANVEYCNESGFTTWLFMNIKFSLTPITAAIDLIILTINLIPLVPNISWRASDLLDDIICGCDRYHRSPFVNDIMQYHCDQCGLEFKSTIFKSDPWINTILLQAQHESGNDGTWQEDNAGNLTPLQILEIFKDVHNAKYVIKNGQLIYETEEWFAKNLTDWIDVDEVLVEDAACYTINTENACSFGRFQYTNDALDEAGNRRAIAYNDIVEWNKDGNEFQKGECTTTAKLSASAFMNDYKSNDIPFIYRFVGVKDPDQFRQDQCGKSGLLILKSGVSDNYKALIWDGVSPMSSAKVISRESQYFASKADTSHYTHDYNYPYFFEEDYDEPELYQTFHFLSDPNYIGRKNIELDEFVFKPTNWCEAVEFIDSEGTDLNVYSSFGKGKPETIKLNRQAQTITVSGVKFCP